MRDVWELKKGPVFEEVPFWKEMIALYEYKLRENHVIRFRHIWHQLLDALGGKSD
jgi:hypothetical protein